MAWKATDLAAYVRAENTSAFLKGTALATLFQMDQVGKAGQAKKLILDDSKVFYEGDEKAAGAALKSQLDAMANNWATAAHALRLLSPDDKAAIRRQQAKGAVETIVDAIKSHMGALGYASFTHKQMSQFLRYGSREEMVQDLADIEAKAEAERQAEAERLKAEAEAEERAAAAEAERLANEPEAEAEPVVVPFTGKSDADIVAEIMASVKARALSPAALEMLGGELIRLHAELVENERLVAEAEQKVAA